MGFVTARATFSSRRWAGRRNCKFKACCWIRNLVIEAASLVFILSKHVSISVNEDVTETLGKRRTMMTTRRDETEKGSELPPWGGRHSLTRSREIQQHSTFKLSFEFWMGFSPGWILFKIHVFILNFPVDDGWGEMKSEERRVFRILIIVVSRRRRDLQSICDSLKSSSFSASNSGFRLVNFLTYKS